MLLKGKGIRAYRVIGEEDKKLTSDSRFDHEVVVWTDGLEEFVHVVEGHIHQFNSTFLRFPESWLETQG